MEDLRNVPYVEFTHKVIKEHPNIGLRECEKIANIIRVCNPNIKRISAPQYKFPLLIGLKVAEPEKYKRFLAKELEISVEDFKLFNLPIVYNNFDHVYNMIRAYAPNRREDRHRAANEYLNIRNFNKLEQSLNDLAVEILEFSNLF